MSDSSNIILYKTKDGKVNLSLVANEGTVWLSQEQIAYLFQKSKSTINEHIKNIFSEEEQNEDSVVRNFRITASDGKNYDVIHYNLDMVLAVGYRVRSKQGSEFRKWATTILKEYLVKGFAMDDDRLKQSDKWDYFDEWLARIRDIRASEKRFYQKVKDLYATSSDYDKNSELTRDFYQKVQAKMVYAVTGKTPAEIIRDRSNSDKVNMGLTSFKGSVVRKGDVSTSKNYLDAEEIDNLNLLVTMFLDHAELKAKRREPMTMAEWSETLNKFLIFNDRDVLSHGGSISMQSATEIANRKYDEFDDKRRYQETLKANEEDTKEFEDMVIEIKQLKK